MPSETVCRDYVETLANNEQDRLKYLLKDKCIHFTLIVIDESEVDKTKFINIIVGDVDVPEKTYLFSSSAALLRPWTKASSAWR